MHDIELDASEFTRHASENDKLINHLLNTPRASPAWDELADYRFFPENEKILNFAAITNAIIKMQGAQSMPYAIASALGVLGAIYGRRWEVRSAASNHGQPLCMMINTLGLSNTGKGQINYFLRNILKEIDYLNKGDTHLAANIFEHIASKQAMEQILTKVTPHLIEIDGECSENIASANAERGNMQTREKLYGRLAALDNASNSNYIGGKNAKEMRESEGDVEGVPYPIHQVSGEGILSTFMREICGRYVTGGLLSRHLFLIDHRERDLRLADERSDYEMLVAQAGGRNVYNVPEDYQEKFEYLCEKFSSRDFSLIPKIHELSYDSRLAGDFCDDGVEEKRPIMISPEAQMLLSTLEKALGRHVANLGRIDEEAGYAFSRCIDKIKQVAGLMACVDAELNQEKRITRAHIVEAMRIVIIGARYVADEILEGDSRNDAGYSATLANVRRIVGILEDLPNDESRRKEYKMEEDNLTPEKAACVSGDMIPMYRIRDRVNKLTTTDKEYLQVCIEEVASDKGAILMTLQELMEGGHVPVSDRHPKSLIGEFWIR